MYFGAYMYAIPLGVYIIPIYVYIYTPNVFLICIFLMASSVENIFIYY